MKRKKIRNRMFAFLAAVLLMILCFGQAAIAADYAGVDPAQPITLTIDLEAQDKCATIYIYKVGEWNGSAGAYVLTEAFSGSGAEIKDLTTSAILDASDILEKYAREQGKKELAFQKTENGIVQFSELTNGLYLICQKREASDSVTISPFLTTLPVMDAEKKVWNYNVTAYPKYVPDQPTSPGPGGGNDPGGGDPTPPQPAPPDQPEVPRSPQIVEDLRVPMSNLPAFNQLIEDLLVPLGVLPRTGDNSVSYGALLVILAVSGGITLALVWKRRRKKAEP